MRDDSEGDSPSALVLDNVQTLRTIDATKDALVERLGLNRELVVDCSRVEEADLSLVQVLLAARKSAENLGGSLRLAALSPALHDVIERSGIDGSDDAERFWTGGAP